MSTNAATPYPRTGLTVDRFRKIIMPNVNPLHFWGFSRGAYFAMRTCDKVIPEHMFFLGNVGRQEIAQAIEDAELTLADYLNYPVYPTWIANESYHYPKYHGKHFTNMVNSSRQRTSIQTRNGKVIGPGRRATSLIESGVTVVYSDEDGDGFDETATISTSGVTVEDKREIKVFHPGVSANERWEIRDFDSLVLDSGTLTIKLKSWVLVDPDKIAVFPGVNEFTGIDPDTSGNFVSTVDLYRVYNDETAVASKFYWEPSPHSLGTSEEMVTQTGTFTIRLSEPSFIVPYPASYSTAWVSASPSVCRSPDRLSMWYHAGYTSNDYEREVSVDPLDDRLARAIAYLAAARLNGNLCDCCDSVIGQLQKNLAMSSEQGNFVVLPEFINKGGGFGPRVGEWYAYNQVQNMDRHLMVGVL